MIIVSWLCEFLTFFTENNFWANLITCIFIPRKSRYTCRSEMIQFWELDRKKDNDEVMMITSKVRVRGRERKEL